MGDKLKIFKKVISDILPDKWFWKFITGTLVIVILLGIIKYFFGSMFDDHQVVQTVQEVKAAVKPAEDVSWWSLPITELKIWHLALLILICSSITSSK
jgi:hypothetical protein